MANLKNRPNKIVTNRKSPNNEPEMIAAYKRLNPKANKPDNKDVAAVVDTKGNKGHALVDQSKNRSKDTKPHIGKTFIPDEELKKEIKTNKGKK